MSSKKDSVSHLIRGSVEPVNDCGMVVVELFLESLSPETHLFIRTTLNKIINDEEMMNSIDLRLYFSGRAKISSNSTYGIKCPHGVEECSSNILEACLVREFGIIQALEMIEYLNSKHSITLSTLQKKYPLLEAQKSMLKRCTSKNGKKILEEAIRNTPPIRYVPSMRVDYGPVLHASDKLIPAICNRISCSKPKICSFVC